DISFHLEHSHVVLVGTDDRKGVLAEVVDSIVGDVAEVTEVVKARSDAASGVGSARPADERSCNQQNAKSLPPFHRMSLLAKTWRPKKGGTVLVYERDEASSGRKKMASRTEADGTRRMFRRRCREPFRPVRRLHTRSG